MIRTSVRPAAARVAVATRKQNAAHSQLEPEMIMTDRDDRIREIAYFLWLDEGCPEGEEERHWAAAEALFESEPEQRKRIEGEPPGEPVVDSSTARSVRRARAI
jgi:Protein of unknown function (DUF2934)